MGRCKCRRRHGIGDITGDLTAGKRHKPLEVYNGGWTIGDITGDMTAGDAIAVYKTAAQSATSPVIATFPNAMGRRCTKSTADIGDITGDMTAGNANGAWAVYKRRHNPATSPAI